MEQLKRDLIKKHIEGWDKDKMKNSSIESFAESGKVSGSIFMALKAMMDEYSQAVNVDLGDVGGSDDKIDPNNCPFRANGFCTA